MSWTKENKDDPVWFIEYFFKCKLWEKQKEIARSVRDYKITAVRSCHASGKSFDAARIGVWFLQTNPDSIVLTTAPSWTQVKEILWREIAASWAKIKDVDDRFVFSGELKTTQIDISPNWFAIGMATRKEGEGSEVADRMLGFHSPTGKILIIVDEGSGIKEPIWGAIDTLLSSGGSKLLAIGNPYRVSGGFADLFKRGGANRIHIDGLKTPNVLAEKILYPGLMSPNYPKEMETKYGKDSNLYLVKVRGEFPKSESDTLIALNHIEEAFTRELDTTGEKLLGVDVARFGGDLTAFVVRQGKKVSRKETYSKEDTMQTVGRTLRIMEEEGIKPENVFIDVIGIGAGVVDRLHEKEYTERGYKKNYNVNGVNVGATAEDDEHFKNLRAEAYWQIRDWIKTADLLRDDDFLQLANIKYKYSSGKKGQLQIEAKEDMKKRGLLSPDVADALMLTFTNVQSARLPVQRENEEDNYGRPITRGLKDMEF